MRCLELVMSSEGQWEALEERIGNWINESINDEAVYRTAPAKPGLLNKSILFSVYKDSIGDIGQLCCQTRQAAYFPCPY